MNKKQGTMAKVFLPLLVIICVLLPGCNNIFSPSDLKGTPPAVEDGYGKLNIRFPGDEARTIFPAKNILRYEYTFTRYDGEEEVESLSLEPGNDGFFTLVKGDWIVEVEAFAASTFAGEALAATGRSELFTIASGSTKQIIITLEGNVSEDAEKGTFSYTILYPADAAVSVLTLQKLPGFTDEPLAWNTISDGVAQTLDVPAGFYLLSVQVKKNGKYAGTGEVIHIYPGLVSEYEYTFAETDFLDSTINISAIPGVTPPANGETPVSAITETAQYSGQITWKAGEAVFNGEKFGETTTYTAVIVLAAKDGYTFTGVAAKFFTVAGAVSVNNDQHSGYITAVFPATLATPPAVVAMKDIPGIVPVVGEAVSGGTINTDQYTGSVTWAPAHGIFASSTTYTASITLTAKPGYTFAGVAANFFKVERAATVSNAANSGIVTATFSPVKVTFDSKGGSAVAPIHTFSNYQINKPADPMEPSVPPPGKDGWTFAGWFYDEMCSSPVTFHQDAFTLDTTLYARWLEGNDWIPIDNDPETLASMFPVKWEEDEEGNPVPVQDGLDGEYFLTEDISLEGYNGLDGTGWMPMGTSEENPFTGIFDGNGRKITYLFIERGDTKCIGLFGAINNAEIRNLGVEIANAGVIGDYDVGGITGNAKNSIIENCYVKGSITANGSVGGIAAHIGSNSIIRNCYTADGTIKSNFSDAGGIVGNMKDGGIIENCYSTMTVIAGQEAAGILAIMQDRTPPDAWNVPSGLFVRNCVSFNSAISTTSLANPYVGRIVGIVQVGPREGPHALYNTLTKTPTALQDINIGINYAWNGITEITRGHNDTDRNGSSVSESYLHTQAAYVSLGWVFNSVTGPWKWDSVRNLPKLYWEED